MTEIEAVKELKQNSCVDCAFGCDSPIHCNAVCKYSDAINMAIKALEKQIPKKPLNIEDKYWGCPCCNGMLMVRWITYPINPVPLESGRDYCEDCGQKIDWSE